jgi:hypothetical protein
VLQVPIAAAMVRVVKFAVWENRAAVWANAASGVSEAEVAAVEAGAVAVVAAVAAEIASAPLPMQMRMAARNCPCSLRASRRPRLLQRLLRLRAVADPSSSRTRQMANRFGRR